MLSSATSSQPSPAPPPPGSDHVGHVANIFRSQGKEYLREHPGTRHDQRRLMNSIMSCRTAEQGGHIYVCKVCGVKDQSYNSCRHRLCPKCEGSKRLKWVEAHKKELLPVDYQHLVFVPPACLAWIIFANTRKLAGLLFQGIADALKDTAADPKYLGAEIGLLAVYQSWGEQMQRHPHIHVCTPAGGISLDGLRWVYAESDQFLPTAVLSERFRDCFLKGLEKLYRKGDLTLGGRLKKLSDPDQFQKLLEEAREAKWHIDSKRVEKSAEVEALMGYLGRAVPITNDRIRNFENGKVELSWQDREDHQERTTTLEATEFIRRYIMHSLPLGFRRIRQCGFLANCHRKKKLTHCRELLVVRVESDPDSEAGGGGGQGYDPTTDNGMRVCSTCGKRSFVYTVLKRQPAPAWIFGTVKGFDSS